MHRQLAYRINSDHCRETGTIPGTEGYGKSLQFHDPLIQISNAEAGCVRFQAVNNVIGLDTLLQARGPKPPLAEGKPSGKTNWNSSANAGGRGT